MKVYVRFEVDLPEQADEATPKQIEDWLRFQLNDTGILTCDFPLADEPYPGPIFGTFQWGVL